MTESEIRHIKKECKKIKKFDNPKNLKLMQIQHEMAKKLGFKNWNDLLKN